MTAPEYTPITAAAQRGLTLWRARLDDPCFVYVVQGGPDMPAKIGWAHDPVARMAILQTGNHLALRLMAVLPGGQALEHNLHRRFREGRISGSEWFEGVVVGEILRFVGSLGEQMAAGYDGSGRCPDPRQFGLEAGPARSREYSTTTTPPPNFAAVPPQVARQGLNAHWYDPEARDREAGG